MRPDPRYDAPFHWWGPGWGTPACLGVRDLLRDETIDCWSAAVLWAALARRQSLTIIAGPSGIGKTTLLTALLEFLPPKTRRVYARGCFETFSFLTDPVVVPTETALLINEISPHLPVYLWGPAVARALDAAERGFTLLTTAHANSVPEFVGALTGSPLRIPSPRVALFEFVVLLDRDNRARSQRRVRGVWRLSATREGVDLESLAPPCLHDISPDSSIVSAPNTPPWFPPQELADRKQILADLRDDRIASVIPSRWPFTFE